MCKDIFDQTGFQCHLVLTKIPFKGPSIDYVISVAGEGGSPTGDLLNRTY